MLIRLLPFLIAALSQYSLRNTPVPPYGILQYPLGILRYPPTEYSSTPYGVLRQGGDLDSPIAEKSPPIRPNTP